jgi:hypothetical protein
MDVSGTYRGRIGGVLERIRMYQDVSKLSGYSDTPAGVSDVYRMRITPAPISNTYPIRDTWVKWRIWVTQKIKDSTIYRGDKLNCHCNAII